MPPARSEYVNCACKPCGLALVQLLATAAREVETVTCPRCGAKLPALSVTATPLAGAVLAKRGQYRLKERPKKTEGKKP